MSRPRTGSVCQEAGRFYARVTWHDSSGKRRDRKRRAMDATHAQSLIPTLFAELDSESKYTRRQPKRAKKYKRNNLQIYCIQIKDGHVNPIKIGTSANIPMRVKMILCHQPYPVEVLATWPGNVKDERAVHEMFATSRMAREWFRPTPEILKYIATKTEAAA